MSQIFGGTGINVIRAIAAILIGYVVFAFSSMVLVGPVMNGSGPLIIVGALVGLASIGLAVGFVTTLVAGIKARLATSVVFGLVVLATVANLLMGLGAEPNWYKVATLVVCAPIILLIGRFRKTPVRAT